MTLENDESDLEKTQRDEPGDFDLERVLRGGFGDAPEDLPAFGRDMKSTLARRAWVPSEAEGPSTLAHLLRGNERYRIVDELGRGGMGVVLLARDLKLGREVAIKIIRGGEHVPRPVLLRFVEEAQIAGQLQHPGIVPIYDVGVLADRHPYFTMKRIEGRTLARFLRTETVDLVSGIELLTQVAEAVAYAHARNVIHRDLKPSNVMLGEFGEVVVLDWGLAKVLGGADEDEDSARGLLTVREVSSMGESATGHLMGTPTWASPEQLLGGRVDRRTDVFALAAMLMEVLVRTSSGDPSMTSSARAHAAAGDLDGARTLMAECDAHLRALALDGLAADSEKRPADAAVFVARLRSWLEGREAAVRLTEVEAAASTARERAERRLRRLVVWLGVAVVALSAVYGVWWWHRESDQERRQAIRAEQAKFDRIAALREQRPHRVESQSDQRYSELFREAGIRLSDHDAAVQAIRVSPRAEDLVVALYDWMIVKVHLGVPHLEDWAKLLVAADADTERAQLVEQALGQSVRVDGESWTTRVRSEKWPPAVLEQLMLVAGNKLSAASAVDLGREACRQHPNDYHLNMAFGRWSEKTELVDWANALRAYTAAAACRPKHPLAYEFMARCLAAQGSREKAVAELLRAAELGEPSARLKIKIGHVLLELQRTADAERAMREALEIEPSSADAQAGLANCLAQAGKLDEAIEVYRDLLQNSGGQPRIAYSLGVLLERARREGEAREVYRDALTRNPESAVLACRLGRRVFLDGRKDEGKQLLHRALALDPDLWLAHYIVGTDAMENGRLLEAERHLERARTIQFDHAASHVNFGIVQLRLGRHAAARAAIEVGAERSEFSPISISTDGLLAQIRDDVAMVPVADALLEHRALPEDEATWLEMLLRAERTQCFLRHARLWHQTFQQWPAVVEHPSARARWRAARAALAAAAGLDVSVADLDELSREAWTDRACRWLRDEIDALEDSLEAGAISERAVTRLMRQWMRDPIVVRATASGALIENEAVSAVLEELEELSGL